MERKGQTEEIFRRQNLENFVGMTEKQFLRIPRFLAEVMTQREDV